MAQPIDAWSPLETRAASFTGDLTGRALEVRDDQSLADEDRRGKFRNLVAELFDVDAVGRLLLGENKARLDDHQLANYSAVVADYLVPIYAARLSQVCNTQPSVVSVREQNGAVFVRTEFTTQIGSPPTYVDWLLSEQNDGSWRALDIAINGVSLVQSKSEEFDAVIANRGPDAFLELLHEQTGDVLPQPLAAPVAPDVPTLTANKLN